MKKLMTLFFLGIAMVSCAQNKEVKTGAPEFIVHMADARLMDREEGRLAASLGTTKAIRDYGSQMVSDQEMLYGKLKQLAASKNITLPDAISEKKSKALKKLSMVTGEDFDAKFLKMIKIDHKRDVKRFTKATEFEDADTRKFAAENLPMIQSHLDKAKELLKNR